MVSNGKVVLAYSGGLDTSVSVRHLQTLHKLDVITVTVDCGQDDDFKEIEKKAKAIGAIKHVYIDAKEERRGSQRVMLLWSRSRASARCCMVEGARERGPL